MLFDPQVLEMDEWVFPFFFINFNSDKGVHEWVHYAIDKCSSEKFEKELWKNVVLSGENIAIPGS